MSINRNPTPHHVLSGGANTGTQSVVSGIRESLGAGALQLTDLGELKVFLTGGAGSGGTSMTDDAAFTVGSGAITPAGGIYRSTRDSVDDGDAGALAMTQKRGLYTTIETPTGDSAMDDTNDAVRVNIVAGSSSGTEYTEDAAAAANPSGGMAMAVRADSLAGVTSADGDNIALRATDKGEVYVKHVDALTVTGVSTSAKQDTIIGHVDGIEGLLTTIDGDTGNISTKVDTLAGAVSGTEMQVDVLSSALPTGAATAAKQPALGTAGTASADVITVQGIASMTALKVDGSAVTQPISHGALTELAAAINSDKLDINIKTSDISFGGTSAADDADFTDGTTPGTPAMGVYESSPSSVTDGDLGVVGITETRRLKTSATIDAALPAGTNNIGDVDVLSSALPTGAATSAKQDTIIGHVDGIEALLTTIDADTSTLAGAVSGTEMQVDVITMPTVTVQATNLDIRDIDKASDDILVYANTAKDGSGTSYVPLVDADGHIQVDVLSGGGGGTQYTEDAAAAGNPVGTALNLIRADALAGVTSDDGDNVAARGTDKGELYVKHVDAIPVTDNGGNISIDDGGNTITVDGTVSVSGVATAASQAQQIAAEEAIQTSVELIDDAIKQDDAAFTPATTKVMMAGFEFDDGSPDSVDEGDAGAARMSANRNIYTTIRDAAGNERGVNVNASNQLAIAGPVTNAGTFAVQVDGSALTALQLIDDTVATLGTTTYTETTTKGNVIGAVRRDADTTLVDTTNEIGPLQMDANGRLKVEIFDSGDSHSVDWNGSQPVTGSGTATGALRVELPTNGTGVISTVTTVSTVSALGAGTTGPMKAEDVASAAGDQGVAIMAVRQDLPIANASVSNDGDYTTPIVDNFRKLWVAGTVPEDVAHIAGEALTVNGVRRIDTAATSAGTSGDWATMDASAEGAIWATLTPTTTSGCSIFRSIDLDESEEEVKATAGNVYGYYIFNAAASIHYLKFYNATAANTTVGTTTPVMTFPIPAGAAAHVGFPYPVSFSTAISAAVTTGLADNDTGAPAANACIVNIFYK